MRCHTSEDHAVSLAPSANAPPRAASTRTDGEGILRLLRAAVEHSPDGVVVSIGVPADPSGLQIVYVNPAFEALAQAQPTSLLGRNPLAVVRGLLDLPTRTALGDAVARGIPVTIESAGAPHCPERSYELSAIPIAREAEPLMEWVWTVRDITKRVKGEERRRTDLQDVLRARNESLAEAREELRVMQRLAPLATLAAGLGHDMSNLLLPMRAHLDRLATITRDPSAVGHLDALHSVLRYLQQLTDSLRLMALDPDRPIVSGETTDLTEWWSVAEPLLLSVIHPSIHRVVDLPDGLPPIRVAPHFLTLAVLNLILNANEAISENGEIRIWAEPKDGGTHVRVGVTDDGCGMSPNVRERAFDPFFSTKRRRHATGLGLALVHGVMRGTQGVVEVETREGEGTTVTLTLPVAEAKAPSPGADEKTAVVRVSDERVAALMRAMLGAAGFAPGPDPTTCSVLVTDAAPGVVEELRSLQARSCGAQVFVYGATRSPEWNRLGAVVIPRDAGPSEIGRAFSRLLVGASDRGHP